MQLLSMMLISTLSAAAEQAPASVCIVSGGTHDVLDRRETAAVVEQIRLFFASCSLESEDDPAVFAKRDLSADWDAAVKEPHLYATLVSAVSVPGHHRQVALTEALIPLDVRGPYWFTRRGKAVVSWTKCTWPAMKPILCRPSVLPHLSTASQEQCRSLSALVRKYGVAPRTPSRDASAFECNRISGPGH